MSKQMRPPSGTSKYFEKVNLSHQIYRVTYFAFIFDAKNL